MNSTPAPVGVLSSMGVKCIMLDFPIEPDSVLLTGEHQDVFVSFHWHAVSALEAHKLAVLIAQWLMKNVDVYGVNVLTDVEGLDNE